MIPQDYEDFILTGVMSPDSDNNGGLFDQPAKSATAATETTAAEADDCDTPGGDIAGQGMFVCRRANEWLRRAAARPNPRELWLSLWYEGEVCCLFADTNAGKSIYAVQIADSIARRQPVLYFDFEMSDKQFQLRYTDPETGSLYRFADGFHRLEFAREYAEGFDLPDIIDHIELQVMETGARVLIVDNLSWVCNRAESGDAAGELMQLLIGLKRRQGLSILVLAHTPKRNIAAPLTQNSLAGSKRIANFMDSMFAIGTCRANRATGRYIKQIKVRNSELRFGDDNVIVAELGRREGMLALTHTDYATEASLLEAPGDDDIDRDERDDEIRRRLREGQPYSSIAADMRVSRRDIARVAKEI